VTAELNINLEDLVSPKTVRRELNKSNIHGRAAIAKPLTTENDAKSEKDGVMIIKPGRLMIGNTLYGQMRRHSRCSQHQTGFVFWKRPRKPVILNAWFQL